ncbi:putative enoyl-CoA hydratase echA8 [compost metagenome]|uniref:Enoyl-CoA hydratase/carnithine racemase n=2 Tax=Pseudomonas jinjuensis TaxID=198616 RepID=A0A1H0D9P0_9PSED|nr:Enoyl-CoA hydratase/carnithine racemase [Pseudomonas jinjuensis]
MNERVLIDIDDEGVAEVKLNRADKMNALDSAMFEALLDAQERLRGERNVRAVVLHGEGRAFCAGLDMSSFAAMAEGGRARNHPLSQRTHGIANQPQQAAWGWRELPVPVIAAVHGVAFGGGLQLALGADMRCVAAETKLSLMEIKWGLIPDMACFPLLRDVLRGDVLRELVYTGRIVTGVEAQALGLATWVGDEPLTRARTLARQIAQGNPDAVRAAKRLLNLTTDSTAAEVLLEESREQDRLIGSPNQREAVRAALEKRAPVFAESLQDN